MRSSRVTVPQIDACAGADPSSTALALPGAGGRVADRAVRRETSRRRVMSTPRQYELVYLVSPEASEQEVTDLHAQVEAIIARIGGELVKTENWGRRKLAYEIG